MGRPLPCGLRPLGGIGPHKGSNVLHDLAVDARLRHLPIQYLVVGYSNMPERLAALGVAETADTAAIRRRWTCCTTRQVDLVLIGSIWPETYCYTLSLAWPLEFPQWCSIWARRGSACAPGTRG